jgi:hypothetical protein
VTKRRDATSAVAIRDEPVGKTERVVAAAGRAGDLPNTALPGEYTGLLDKRTYVW